MTIFQKLAFSVIIGLFTTTHTFAQGDAADVNPKIIEFCKKSMGKKIDRGECWDLAKFALDYANADWNSPYDFGIIVDPNEANIIEGDIIQFENVKLSNRTTFPHHTAIVYQVLEPKKYIIIHQNFNSVKKVSTLELDLNLLTKGSITFYRPRGRK